MCSSDLDSRFVLIHTAASMETWFPTFQRLANREVPLPAVWPRAATATQRQMLLALIALSIEENVPLAPLLDQWAKDERGLQRSRIRRLVRLLRLAFGMQKSSPASGGAPKRSAECWYHWIALMLYLRRARHARRNSEWN